MENSPPPKKKKKKSGSSYDEIGFDLNKLKNFSETDWIHFLFLEGVLVAGGCMSLSYYTGKSGLDILLFFIFFINI